LSAAFIEESARPLESRALAFAVQLAGAAAVEKFLGSGSGAGGFGGWPVAI
jgi:hypothetical protein